MLLLNFGGPRTLEEVPGFLYEILSDPNTLQLPVPQWVQNRIARAITRRRGTEIARQYGVIGGRSPLVESTERIAASLKEALEEAGAPLPVHIVHRYLPGQAAAAMETLLATAPDALLALPLYPHFTYATTGSALAQVMGLLERAGWEGAFHALRSYPDDPRYLEALTARLAACLAEAAPPREETVILCSAHGLPKAYVERGDPYREELLRTLAALREAFPQWRFELSFQSRVGPAEWLRPYTDEIIGQLAAAGTRHLVFLPISFVNDHIETLYEIGVTYFALAREAGMTPYRVPAVEDHPGLIRVLAEAALKWRASGKGEPAGALLPPGQTFRRHAGWVLGLALGLALAGLAAGAFLGLP